MKCAALQPGDLRKFGCKLSSSVIESLCRYSRKNRFSEESPLSFNKPTAQSDTSWFGHSWRAVDGDDGVFYWNS